MYNDETLCPEKYEYLTRESLYVDKKKSYVVFVFFINFIFLFNSLNISFYHCTVKYEIFDFKIFSILIFIDFSI